MYLNHFIAIYEIHNAVCLFVSFCRFYFSLLVFSYFLMYYSLNRVSKLFISGDKNYLQKFRAHFSNWKLLILEGICISIFIHFSLAGGKKRLALYTGIRS